MTNQQAAIQRELHALAIAKRERDMAEFNARPLFKKALPLLAAAALTLGPVAIQVGAGVALFGGATEAVATQQR